ncbi:hypothetical protein [Alistipes communis]|jgi:hypothetical protein|uniref:hypothetical protein n=1 Tax=Alistipes communis TaxID=2585118 RepID=UPI00189929D1|nr:hypothetical protein [Alistipes communis]
MEEAKVTSSATALIPNADAFEGQMPDLMKPDRLLWRSVRSVGRLFRGTDRRPQARCPAGFADGAIHWKSITRPIASEADLSAGREKEHQQCPVTHCAECHQKQHNHHGQAK